MLSEGFFGTPIRNVRRTLNKNIYTDSVEVGDIAYEKNGETGFSDGNPIAICCIQRHDGTSPIFMGLDEIRCELFNDTVYSVDPEEIQDPDGEVLTGRMNKVNKQMEYPIYRMAHECSEYSPGGVGADHWYIPSMQEYGEMAKNYDKIFDIYSDVTGHVEADLDEWASSTIVSLPLPFLVFLPGRQPRCVIRDLNRILNHDLVVYPYIKMINMLK